MRINKTIVLGAMLLIGFFIQINFVNGQSMVYGKLMDKNGNPIAKAEIRIEDKSTIQTNDAGRFKINAELGDTLQFQKSGYLHKNFTISDLKNITVVLEKDIFLQKRTNVFADEDIFSSTSSVSSVSGDDLSYYPTQNLSSALAGKLSGLTVLQKSGEPGDNSSQLLIRGRGTFDNSFLVFVDGFEADLDQLTASEIETISVLKDAAALAPFGIRGANGVLWITTKKGIVSPLRVEFESRAGVSQTVQLPKFSDSYTYASLYNEAFSNDAGVWTPVYTSDELNKYRTGEDPLFYPNVNWYDENLDNIAPYSENHISIRGGSEFFKYYLLLGYKHADKIYKERESNEFPSLRNTGQSERYNFRSNIDLTINKIFSSSIRIGGSLLDNTEPALNNMFGLLEKYPPNIYSINNPDGSWGGSSLYPNNLVAGIQDMGARSSHQRYIQTGLKLKEDLGEFIPGLSFSQELDMSSWYSNDYNQLRTAATFQPYLLNDSIQYIQRGFDTPFSISDNGRSQWSRINYALSGNYVKSFENLKLSTFITYRQDNLSRNDESIPFIHSNLAGNLKFDIKETYYAGFSLAYSGSQNYPEGSRFGLFPTFSAGWMASNSNTISNIGWIDILKIRGSAGVLGYESQERFAYLTYFPRASNIIFGATGIESQRTLSEGRIGNPNIVWESSTKYNLGLDARLFEGKLDITLDYFYDMRKNILTQRTQKLPAVLGVDLPLENIGEISNRGLELDLMYTGNLGSFQYNLGGMFSYAKSKVEYLDELHTEDYLYRTGNPVGQIFGLEATGFFQSWDEINDPSTPIHTFAPVQPGDIRYEDKNKDGLITDDDISPIGKTAFPEINYSFSFGANWKRFDVEMFVFGVANRSITYNGNAFFAFQNNSQVPAIAEERWAYYPDQGIDTRASAKYPRLSTLYNENNYRKSTFWTHSGNFLSIKNIELGYTIPMNQSENPFVKNLRIYVSGINLLTIDNLDNYNAEVLTGYPLMRSYHIGFKMNL